MTRGRIKQRGRVWWIYYYWKGKEWAETSRSADRKDAERLLARRLGEIGADEAGMKRWIGPEGERVLVNTLLDEMVAAYEIAGARGLATAESRVKPLKRAFEKEQIRHLDTPRITRYIQQRKKMGKAPATIKLELAFLHRAVNLAHQQGRISQVPHFPDLKVDNARQGFFEEADLNAVIEYLPAYLKDVVRFAFLSGWRKQEILGLTWAEVDLAGRVVKLNPKRSKTGKGRTLALVGELWEIVKRQRALREYSYETGIIRVAELVFHRDGQRISTLDYAWHKACEKAGITGMVFHDLRRSAVRNLTRAGVPQSVAMKVTGHQTASIFNRYDITNEEDLRIAQEKLQAYLEASKGDRTIIRLGG